MKKLFAIVLSAAVVLLGFGYFSTLQQAPIDEIGSAGVITLSINPKINIHYDDEGKVVDLRRNFGISLSMKLVGEHLHAAGGFRAVPVTPWTRAVFYALRRLPQEDQSRYCVLKTFELLYLICTQEREEPGVQRGGSGSAVNVANNMKTYMEAHLDEKLTITELSHRFHLSRTACKSAFRSCFDQPIHAWLLDRRMERAAELLEKTKMPILQVAQSVGYTGVSQFNVAFRQRYGKSPREYRKMSVSVAF